MNQQTRSYVVEEERLFGRDAALLIARFRFWILRNIRNEKNHHSGRTWSFSTQAELSSYLGISERSVRRVTKKLKDEGILLVGQLHRNTSNRTNWYAFVDEEVALEGFVTREYLDPPCGQPVLMHADKMSSSHEDKMSSSSIEVKRDEEIKDGNPADFNSPLETELEELTQSKLKSFSNSDVSLRHREFFQNACPKDNESKNIGAVHLVNTEEDSVSENTKTRNEAFLAMQRGKAKTPDEDQDRRGDLGRRQERDNRAGKPRKPSARPDAAPRQREALRSPVYEAWRDAMAAVGLSPGPVVERGDVKDANDIVDKFGGSESDAIAYVVWTVQNWDVLARKHKNLDSYTRTFGLFLTRWNTTLRAEWMKARSKDTAGASIQVQGSDAFREYMALPPEDKTDPKKLSNPILDSDEFVRAVDAHAKAKLLVWEKRQEQKIG